MKTKQVKEDTSWKYEIYDRIFNFIGHLITPEWDNKLLGISKFPVKTILDIGANNGQFARKVSKIFPKANIYSFEPIPRAFKHLQKWAEKQDNRVKVYQLALSDREQDLEINLHKQFSASSSFLPTTELSETKFPMTKEQEKILVSQKKLDDIFCDNEESLIPDILVKLDVQGYEDKVIQGGYKTFERSRACIVEISLDKLYQGQADFKTIFSLLSNLGYEYKGNIDQIKDKDGHIIFLNAVFIK